jgi:hypothetical protein
MNNKPDIYQWQYIWQAVFQQFPMSLQKPKVLKHYVIKLPLYGQIIIITLTV